MELTRYSKDGSRPLSPFHAREMLYEYACGSLDAIRSQALEEYLKTDSNLQSELARIRQSLAYLERLSDFKVSPEKIAQLRVSTTWAERMAEKLRMEDWPAGVKLGLESMAVVSAIFVIAIAVPWNSLFEVIQDETGSTTLAEIRRDFRPQNSLDEYPEDSLMEMVKGIVFDDEGTPENESRKGVRQIAAVPQISKNESSDVLPDEIQTQTAANVKTVEAAKTPPAAAGVPASSGFTKAENSKRETSSVTASSAPQAPVAAPAPTMPQASSMAGTGPVVEPAAAKVTAGAKDPLFNQGFLYRGRLKATNVEAITPKLVEFVTELGGRKAGQVDLGWSKGQGSYFHFTIPEAKYEELVKFFREYGSLAISKERHSKVMPEGIIRLIIEVEEKNP